VFNLGGPSSVASTHGPLASIADGGSNYSNSQEHTLMNTRRPSIVERRMGLCLAQLNARTRLCMRVPCSANAESHICQ
jgi:hypothetical protein